jgi:hypothetical protein
MNATVPVHEIYRTYMLEFKLRLQHCERIVGSSTPVTGLAALDSEFCFLQIRRLMEIITFSAFLRDEARYKKLRELQRLENPRDHGNHSRDWEAPEILRRLAQISPYCLPIPLKPSATRIGETLHLDRKGISVTHGRLIEIYGICGRFLHAKNPFDKDFPDSCCHRAEEVRGCKHGDPEVSAILSEADVATHRRRLSLVVRLRSEGAR